MFYDKTTDRQAKYALRKKKNGGGAASFLIGTVVLGGLMLGGATSAQADSNNLNQNNGNTEETGYQKDKLNSSSIVLGTQSSGPQSSGTHSLVNDPVTSSNFNGPINNEPTSDAPASNELASNKTEKAVDATGSQNLQGQNQNANQKVTITNVTFNKDEIKESEGTDLKITFNWEATGLHKGDTMEIPMFEGFDSIYKQVDFPVKSDELIKMGTLQLDYDAHKINVNFTADLDPDKLYRGQMKIGTFVSRDYFKNLNNETVVPITLPNGTTIKKPLTVIFDEAPEYHKHNYSYEQATKYVMSDNDKTQADVSWAVLINPQGEEMQQPTIYLTTNKIADFGNPNGQVEISYATPATPSTLDPGSIKLYEAQSYPSLGYTKGKQLTSGVDYEITEGKVKDVWLVKLKGNYLTTNGQFVVEYNTHHDHLDPNASSGDSGTAVKTEVTNNGLLAYQNVNNQLGGGLFGATVRLIDSDATVEDNYGSKDPVTPTPEVKKGNVDVTYVTEDGKTLKATEQVFKDSQAVGTDYTTEQRKFTGYHFVRMGEFSADPAGKVTENLQHVVYVYAANPVEKKGSVDVKYITKDGKVLKDVTSVKDNAPVGEEYKTEEKTFEGYHFVGMDKTSDPATGVVAEGTKHVIYVYEKDPVTPTPEVKRGTVTVEYVDKTGNPLPGGQQTTVKDNVPVGEDYTTEEKQFDGYHFVGMDKTSDPANGKVAEGTKHVIYVYEKDVTPEVKRGTVTVEYVDKNGNPLPGGQQTTVKDNVPVGEDYTTEEKTFDGYHFVGMDKTSDPANGKVAEGTKHVIYVYEKDPVAQTGNVDVQYITYVDGKAVELPGGERTPLFTTDQAVDTPYTTNVRNFDNYHFVGMDQSSAAATGKVTNGVQHVIYVYEKNVTPTVQRGSVDVIYVDEHGNPLPGGELTTVKSNEPVGTSYTTTQREFEGYTFTRMGTGSATPSGTVVPGVSHVIYVYTKDEPLPTPKPGIEGGTVTVTYVDEHGNPLPGGEETPVKDHAPVGETYTTTQRDFPGYTFTGMGEGSATPTGIVVPGTTRVVYVYTKTPTPTTETPTTPTTSTTPTPTASTPVAPAPVTPVAPSQPAAPASAKLPQTGNQANDSTAALGLAGLGLSALAALGLRKKKNS